MRLKPKIALLILPIILLQIIVLITSSFMLYQKNFTEQIKGHIHDSIAQVQNAPRMQIEAVEADSLFFSENVILNRYLRIADKNTRFNIMHRALLNKFSALMNAHPEYIEISLLMPDGSEEVSLLKEATHNQSDNEQDSFYFQNIATSAADVEITPLINPDTGQWAIVLARKFFQKT